MSDFYSLLLVLICLPYALVPFFVYKTQRFPLKFRLREHSEHFLPKSVRDSTHKRATKIHELGFLKSINFSISDLLPGVETYVQTFVNQTKGIMALNTVMVAGGKIIRQSFEFLSVLSDGREILTHNSDSIGAPIEPQHKISNFFPSSAKLSSMLLCHENVCRSLLKPSTKYEMPTEGLELDFLQKFFDRSLLAQEKIGGVVKDLEFGQYRPSLAGAFLMAWYGMWPFNTLRRLYGTFRSRRWTKPHLPLSEQAN